MLVTSPSKALWYGKESKKDEAGGYEVRRKDWNEALARVRNSTRNEWEARTVYMEGIPVSNRTVPGIYHFASSLLRSSETAPRVQSITLPPHHLDRPGDVPKCKGFALVTLADSADMSRMVSEWPWSPRRSSVPASSDPSCIAPHEAVKFGFRTITKARWDELKEEYLAYRQRLLNEVAGATRSPDTSEETRAVRETEDTNPASMNALPSIPPVDPSAPFPPGCLVFVRNVHPETNKTTLKALFTAHAFGGAPSPSSVSALDYIDYSKGMTSCHLRLSTSHHANTFVAAFRSRPLVQRTELDSVGTTPSDVDPKPIEAEVVDGEREALYWNKVPEKVRREAVRKAGAGAEEGTGEDDGGGGGEEIPTSRRPRKRRRKA